MNTHETYVSLETAKLLKQAGFDWECPNMYLFTVRGHEIHGMYKGWMPSPKDYWCPSLAVAQRWLREVRGINLEVMFLFGGLFDGKKVDAHYYARAYDLKNKQVVVQVRDCASKVYESALEDGIQKCLTFLMKGE